MPFMIQQMIGVLMFNVFYVIKPNAAVGFSAY